MFGKGDPQETKPPVSKGNVVEGSQKDLQKFTEQSHGAEH